MRCQRVNSLLLSQIDRVHTGNLDLAAHLLKDNTTRYLLPSPQLVEHLNLTLANDLEPNLISNLTECYLNHLRNQVPYSHHQL